MDAAQKAGSNFAVFKLMANSFSKYPDYFIR